MAVVIAGADDDDDGANEHSSGRIVIPNGIEEAIGRSLSIPNLMGLPGVPASVWQSIIPDLIAPLWQSAMTKIDFLDLIAPKLDIASLSPITVGIGKEFAFSILKDFGKSSLLAITPGMDSLVSRIIPTFNFLKGLDLDLTRGSFPTNLEKHGGDIETLKRLTLDEGLPIAWVPRAQTMGLIFEAKSASERRAIYGRRWRGIIADCEELADKMNSVALAPYMRYLQATINAMRDGHHVAAQSLAANTMDTVAYYLAPSVLNDARNPGVITDPEKMPVRTFFAWAQLAGTYTRYFREKNDPIPTTFNRHGATHGVSHRQYSRLNATLGMAHLTSLMWIIDSQTRHVKNPRSPHSAKA